MHGMPGAESRALQVARAKVEVRWANSEEQVMDTKTSNARRDWSFSPRSHP